MRINHWIAFTVLVALVCPMTAGAADGKASLKSQSEAPDIRDYLNPRKLFLRSSAAFVMDQDTHEVLYQRRASKMKPIASITKLMTAMVIIDAKLDMDESIKILNKDKDRIRYSRSRLRVGTVSTRAELLQLALMASENRAAFALARTFPGGKKAFVKAMNKKAKALGMYDSRFADPTGLDSDNKATPKDLAILVDSAYQYPTIREYTTKPWSLLFTKKDIQKFRNTNRLIRKDYWDIGLSKTGFISDAGFCLVMQANIEERNVVIILLNSWGRLSKYGDANRIRKWLLRAERRLEKEMLETASTS